MFMGEYSHTIDAKGRLILPAKFREELGATFFITRGLDNCLTVYTKEGFENLAAVMQQHPNAKGNVRAIKRFFFGNAAEVECDRQGRILIPGNLREYAKLGKEVVVVGTADRVEIWSRAVWDSYNEDIGPDMENIAESLEELNFSF